MLPNSGSIIFFGFSEGFELQIVAFVTLSKLRGYRFTVNSLKFESFCYSNKNIGPLRLESLTKDSP